MRRCRIDRSALVAARGDVANGSDVANVDDEIDELMASRPVNRRARH